MMMNNVKNLMIKLDLLRCGRLKRGRLALPEAVPRLGPRGRANPPEQQASHDSGTGAGETPSKHDDKEELAVHGPDASVAETHCNGGAGNAVRG